ncbi:hypothetical protein [Nitrosococcus wardiae]|uniref:Uncharacterized protein n=1 Tax=Nitrosococcus wardiae TaxID=1814290 RepID=A0A4P7C009_9GAMM|nr:hypothetical protein [Nitrosococcus wardiae]QBQ54947.1 hypothetical protein E3U44_10780 [Nitrosococcus wardiae]
MHELTDKLITRLWAKMTQIYGHKWSSSYGDSTDQGKLTETARTWKKGLRGITGEQIAHGLARCLERDDPWPPTLPEFRVLCLGCDVPHKQNAAAYRKPEHLALPKPRPSRDKARPYLQSLRAALRGAEQSKEEV